MKRKLTLIAATVALGALLVTGATLAWFTSTDTATNVVTVGNVEIKIDETTKDTNVTKDENGSITWNDLMTPGQVLSKQPKIGNTGDNTAWVRASVNIEYYKDGDKINKPDGVDEPTIDYKEGTGETEWTLEDGYYYFNSELEKGQFTSNLFETVTIPNTWTNQGNESMAGVTIKVVVNAEAIQYDNNLGVNEEGVKPVIKAFEGFKAE